MVDTDTFITILNAIDEVKADKEHSHDLFIKSGPNSSAGMVPAPPQEEGHTKFLREDGVWEAPYTEATSTTMGLMTPEDKIKLDGMTNYSHPSYSSESLGLYKIEIDNNGHVNAVSEVTKSDIESLGFSGSATSDIDWADVTDIDKLFEEG